jgi:WD40 repeat protein
VGTGQNSQTGEHGVFLWDLDTGELLSESGELGSIVWEVAFTPDGEQMAAALDDGTVRFWRGDRLEPTGDFQHAGAVNSIAFSADGRLLAAGISESAGGVVMIWDHVTQELIRRFWAHPYSVPSLAFSPTGQYLATGAVDRSVKVWQVSDGRLVTTLPQDGQGTSVQFSDSGDRLISGMCALSDSNLRCQRGEAWVWSVPDWNRVQVLSGPVDWVEGVAFSPSGDLVAGAGRDFGVYLWRVEDGELLRTLIGHEGSIADVGFTPDGTLLLSGSSDESVGVWGIAD